MREDRRRSMSACAWWLYSPKGENRDCRPAAGCSGLSLGEEIEEERDGYC